MSHLRLLAALAGIAMIVSVLAAQPALADEAPTPDPSTTSSPEPSTVPTPEPTVDATPSPEPTAPVTLAPMTPAAQVGNTVGLSGTLSDFADDGGETDPGLRAFQVGTRFLLVDVGGTTASSVFGETHLDLRVPQGVDGSKVSELVAYSTDVAPLRVTGVSAGWTAATINETPRLADADITHQLYLIPVTPSNTHQRYNQFPTYMMMASNRASLFWSDQSNGTLKMRGETFTNVDTDYHCTSTAGTVGIWNEAARAAGFMGFTGGPAQHVVAVLPWDANCGAPARSTWGAALDSGGVVMLVGSDEPEEQATLVRELGHNMSIGNADWLECGAANPLVGAAQSDSSTGQIAGCEVNYWGDLSDVMGYAIDDKDGGALSSPSAIRAQVWKPSAYAVAPPGIDMPYTLNSISSHSGLRSVVVQDTDGVEYYVEFRNFTNEDAQLAGLGCYPEAGTGGGGACLEDTPGVRILRFEPWDFDGQAGSDSYVIGHNGTSVKFGVGESFTTPFGVGITVSAITADTATVSVTRPDAERVGGAVGARPSYSYDGSMRVEDRWTALLGHTWVADEADLSYQWLRDGVAIPGATSATYKLASADYKAMISVRVSMPGNGPDDPDIVSTSQQYGPVTSSVWPMTCPYLAAHIDRSIPLSVIMSGFPSGTTYTYEWGHGAPGSFKAIDGATASTYTLTTKDYGYVINVHVKAKVPGFQGTTQCIDYYDATLTYIGSASIVGEPRVGTTLTQTNNYEGPGTLPDNSISTRWLRDGVLITGADQSTYLVRSGDYGHSISMRTTITWPGYAPRAATSPGMKITLKGVIAATDPTVDVTADPGVKLSAAVSGITEPSVKKAYQWYRITGATQKAITDAIASTYQATKADYGSQVSVRVTVTKSNYTSVVLWSDPVRYAVVADPAIPVVTGVPKVGEVLSVAPRSYSSAVDGAPIAGAELFQWLRDGSPITNATSRDYQLSASDKGKTISVRVTMSAPGLLSSITKSGKFVSIGTQVFPQWDAPASVTQSGMVLTATPGVDTTGLSSVTTSYQWYRGSSAVTGATKSTYTLSGSDRGKLVHVVVTTEKSGYTTVIAGTPGVNYSMAASGPVVIIGTAQVGQTLSVQLPTYTPTASDVTYRWYRDGVATSVTAPTYLLKSVDKGTRISVRVTATAPEFVSSVLKSASTAKVIV